MCGIVGALDLRGQREFPLERLRSMAGSIAHRGPDDEYFHREPGLVLGTRRLAIVDLEGGRQPLANENESVWVSFNGELFDYPELRQALLERGHGLATRCDTEIWVHMYEEHQEGVFDRLSGQFGVALWDRGNRLLLLGRDRIGIVPLYYTEADGWLLWASEIKALLASGMVPVLPDPRGIDHLFCFFSASQSRTAFQGIELIRPGHYLRVRHGRIEKRRYWDLDFPDDGEERRLTDPTPFVDELGQRLQQAVKRRLRGDVPVVSYISGGLDSTVVLGLASRQRGEPVPAFTIGLDQAGPDERSSATESAGALGAPLTTLILDRAKLASAFPDLMLACEGPVYDTSSAALMLLAEVVHAQGYKVALTGEGSDEALAGYAWHKIQTGRDWLARHGGLGFLRLARAAVLASIGVPAAGLNPGAPAQFPMMAIQGSRVAQQDLFDFVGQARLTLYSRVMWECLGDYDPYSELDLDNRRFPRWNPLNQSLYVGYKVLLAGHMIISKADRIMMRSSVEGRYPFLDEDVIDFCASLAPEYKLRGLTDKWLLRRFAARMLPPRIANRPKTMFRAKLAKSFLGPDRPAWVDQLLSPDSLRASGYFDPNAVARERRAQVRWPRLTPRRFVFDVALTSVVATQLWHHLFFGGLCDLPVWSPPTPTLQVPTEPVIDSNGAAPAGAKPIIPLKAEAIP
jgi:asparagine synthase (glutamine-hydrolysing)